MKHNFKIHFIRRQANIVDHELAKIARLYDGHQIPHYYPPYIETVITSI